MKLALKTVNADMTSRGGFRWPESGHVEAPDWNPTPECGGGLHALIWGEGDGALLNWSADARWLVLAIAADVEVIDLNGKAKFPRCDVVHCGTRLSAAQYIVEHGGFGRAVVGATLTGGYRATLTGGDGATLTGGVGATLTGGNYATLTIHRYDGKRIRVYTAYVGEGGIKPGVPYTLGEDGKFVEVATRESA